MLEFELSKAVATLENVNLRVEKDGADKIPAADLKISCATNADVLAFFAPSLKNFIFNENGPRDLADGMPLRDPHLVFPLVRDEEMAGATVAIGFGVDAPMTFQDAKVNAFRISATNGGSVIIAFRVQCRPSPDQIGKLYQLQERGIEVTVEPAELPEMKDAA